MISPQKSDVGSDSVGSPAATPSAGGYRPLRVWPALPLVPLMLAARYSPYLVEDGPPMMWAVAAFGPLLCGLLILIWWLGFSRARWTERIVGFLGLGLGFFVTGALCHPSMRGPAFSMFTIPVGIACFAIGASLFRGTLGFSRTSITLAIAWCGFLSSTALRAEGVWGDFGVTLTSRWKEDAEQRMLAERKPSGSETNPGEADPALVAALENPEWPGYRGPNRDGKQQGTKIDSDWKANPPERLWKIAVGPGWSSFAVAGKWLFTQEQRGGAECAVCYDGDTGREVWVASLESRFEDPLGGPGPRATPTLANGALYAMGGQGFLTRVDARTGELKWKQDLRQAAGRQPPMWGYSSSPLVIDGVVVVHAAGAGDKGMIAFDAETGERRWSAESGENSYSSPQKYMRGEESFVAMLSDKGLGLHDPKTGAQRFHYDWPFAGYRAIQPVWLEDDQLLVPTGMGAGTRRIRLTKKPEGAFEAEEIWTSRNLKPDFNDFVVYQDHAYGFDAAQFTCLGLNNGGRRWKGGRYGKGQVLLLEDCGLLIVLSETGELVLLKADPASHQELARIQALEGKTWNHPVVVGDRIYIRNAQEAVCYKLPLAKP